MKPKKLTTNHDEINMWQPTSDMLSALLYILMLIVLLLGLYLIQIPEHTEIDPDLGDDHGGGWYNEGGSPSPLPTPTPTPDYDDGGGHGGWHNEGGYPTFYPTPSATVSPTPTVTPTYRPINGSGGGGGGGNGGGSGPGDEPDNGFKSAVYVMVIDAETERTIKEGDVQFELYMADGSLQILNTYYPDRVSYRSFVTTESGTFYLPEKLMSGSYELHQLTEPEGYDPAPNQLFVLHDMYDWPDPYVVRVPVYPSRNIIRVQMTDVDTGLPVSGGTFDVISVDDVITPDGTLRYRAGEIVSSITCDEQGYGESDEIYLGRYTVKQKDIPAYYAALTETLEVDVAKKSDIKPPLNTLTSERTTMTLMLADELYPTRGLAGATFTVRSDLAGAEPFEVTTDSLGRITLNELDKGATYKISQSGTVGAYRADADVHTFGVTGNGLIGDTVKSELNITNRLLRVSIGVTDDFSNVQVPGVNLALYNAADELISSWTTSGSSLLMEDLEIGSYYLIKDGDTEQRYHVTVRDQAKIQVFNVSETYAMQYIILGVAAAAVLGAGIILTVLLRRRKRKADKSR